mmetsp:Transcript_1664/g.1833  ORF Transcript_1664/g.1833 Transcript_1664/m.1833 type:complete len:122 (-) Transcript_1664:29-394(-)
MYDPYQMNLPPQIVNPGYPGVHPDYVGIPQPAPSPYPGAPMDPNMMPQPGMPGAPMDPNAMYQPGMPGAPMDPNAMPQPGMPGAPVDSSDEDSSESHMKAKKNSNGDIYVELDEVVLEPKE